MYEILSRSWRILQLREVRLTYNMLVRDVVLRDVI